MTDKVEDTEEKLNSIIAITDALIYMVALEGSGRSCEVFVRDSQTSYSF